MSDGALGVALAAGVLSVLNPCGVALLPAWIARLTDQRSLAGRDLLGRTGVGVHAGLAVSAGFAIFFVPLGLAASVAIDRAASSLPWLGAALGGILLLLGLWMAAGRTVPSPQFHKPSRVTRTGTLGLVAYGVAYGTTALGCAFPTFLLAVGLQSGQSSIGIALRVVTFAAGAAIVLLTISVVVVVATGTPSVGPAAQALSKFTPALLVLTGAFMAAREARLALADQGTHITADIIPLGVALAAVALAAITVSTWTGGTRSADVRSATGAGVALTSPRNAPPGI